MSRAGRFTLIMAILTLGACLGPMLSILIFFGGPWLILIPTFAVGAEICTRNPRSLNPFRHVQN
jgi:hypothetical protein